MSNTRAARVGDRIRVNGGPYDERVGRITMTKGQDDILFQQGPRPLHGLLSEDMALVTFESDGTEVGVPIRRLEVI